MSLTSEGGLGYGVTETVSLGADEEAAGVDGGTDVMGLTETLF